MKERDIASGLFWLVIGLGLSLWTSASYEIGSLTQPGTGYLAFVLGIMLILLSLFLLVGQINKAPRGDRTIPPAAGFGGWKRVFYTVLVMTVAALVFEPLGYLLTFFFVIVLLMMGGGRLDWKRILATAVLTTLGFYVVFVRLLDVQLPRGLIGI